MTIRDDRCLRAATVLLAALFLLTPLMAQQASIYSSLVGTVADPSGAGVPGATVTAANTATNITRSVTTDEQGNYRIEPLLAGPYSISVEKAGFKKFLSENLTLSERQTVRTDVALEVGNVSESVTTVATIPLIETESAQVTSDRSWDALKFLPQAGGTWWQTTRC